MQLDAVTTGEDGMAVITHRTKGGAVYDSTKLRLKIVHPVTGDCLHLPCYNAQMGNVHWAHDSSLLHWIIFDDRKLYKPEETVYFKGLCL